VCGYPTRPFSLEVSLFNPPKHTIAKYGVPNFAIVPILMLLSLRTEYPVKGKKLVTLVLAQLHGFPEICKNCSSCDCKPVDLQSSRVAICSEGRRESTGKPSGGLCGKCYKLLKRKLISADLLFISWLLIGSNLNVLCNLWRITARISVLVIMSVNVVLLIVTTFEGCVSCRLGCHFGLRHLWYSKQQHSHNN
jgi:hypothetical protein